MFIPLKSCAVTRSLANNEGGLPRVSPIRVKRLQIRVRGLFIIIEILLKKVQFIYYKLGCLLKLIYLIFQRHLYTYFENNDRLFGFWLLYARINLLYCINEWKEFVSGSLYQNSASKTIFDLKILISIHSFLSPNFV